MSQTGVSLPSAQYLALVGEVGYVVTWMEAVLLNDMGWIERDYCPLPAVLTSGALGGLTAGKIGAAIRDQAAKVDDEVVAKYLARGGEALVEAAKIRNGVLHARPVTSADGTQVLRRDDHVISEDQLRRLLDRLRTQVTELSGVRPPFRS